MKTLLTIILALGFATSAVASPTAAARSPFANSYAEGNLTGSLGAVDGALIFGVGYQLEFPTTLEGNRFAFGGQTGFYYSSSTETLMLTGINTKKKAWTIPLLATGKYFFSTTQEYMKPYIALGIGFSIDHASVEVTPTATVAKTSGTTLHFAMLIRPGVTFGTTQTWFAELPVGVLLSDFVILPTIGYHF